MYILKYSSHFKRDLKIYKHNEAVLKNLTVILNLLAKDEKLPENNHNHPLVGEFENCYECHIKPDILLIYKKDKSEITILLLRIGSHSDLF